jgi:hypothetical protein
MRAHTILLLLLTASAVTRPANAEPMGTKGSSLFASCKIGLAGMEQPDKPLSPHDLLESGVCISYVQGFLDARFDATDGMICTRGHSYQVIIRVYVKFMEENPLYLDEHRSDGFRAALLGSFPCKSAEPTSPPKP